MKWRRWFLVAVLLVLALLAVSPLALWAQTGQPPWTVGAYLFHDEVKVVVGGPRSPDGTNMAHYTTERTTLLRQLAQPEPDREMEAVLVFSAFLSPDETAALVEKHHLRAEEIYLAVPNVEGGGGAVVFSSVQGAYHNYIEGTRGQVKSIEERIEELKGHGIDPSGYLKRAQAVLDGKAGIHAVRVRGRLADLATSVEDPVRFVDVFYHPDVEAAARVLRKGPVHYVVCPVRPDGLP